MEQFKRNLEETNVIRSEKSSSMEDKYANSPDPWKNGERGIYYPMMEKLVFELLNSTDALNQGLFHWYDIGCGGGNVGKAIYRALKNRDKESCMFGMDISESAINYLREDPESPYNYLHCADIEKMSLEEARESFGGANVISLVEVMYYLGEKKPWKQTIDTLWEALTPGTIVVIADGLISYQYREYLKNKEDANLIVSYTDMETPVCREVSDNGREWNRYLKVRIYQKALVDPQERLEQ